MISVAVPELSIHGASQVLRPPEARLPYVRHDRAGEIDLSGGGVSVAGGRIAALEPAGRAPVQVDATGGAVVPGLVDCHTHLPFAGWQPRGADVAAAARAFAAAGDAALLRQGRGLADEMLRHGTTSLDCRSGYGLEPGEELRALRLVARLGEAVRQRVTATALLAHAVPAGTDAGGWLDAVEALLPRVVAETRAQSLEAVVPGAGFEVAHLRRLAALARGHDLALRVVADQGPGARATAEALALGARSVAGLWELHPEDVAPLAQAECAAVLLPVVDLLSADHVAPGRRLADAGAICVLATGCNPGTAPVTSLPLAIGLAARLYGFTAAEALLACTLNAAWVLGLSQETGSLEPGKRADLLVLDGPVEHVPYRFARNPVAVVVCGGEIVWVRPDQAWRVTRAGAL